MVRRLTSGTGKPYQELDSMFKARSVRANLLDFTSTREPELFHLRGLLCMENFLWWQLLVKSVDGCNC